MFSTIFKGIYPRYATGGLNLCLSLQLSAVLYIGLSFEATGHPFFTRKVM